MNLENLYSAYLSSDGVSTDTRENMKNTIFFALKGDRFDGNSFVEQALEAGALCVVADGSEIQDERIVTVPDSLETLQALGLHHRRKLGIPVLAITGSNGKTTTKELCHAVLSAQYRCTATKGNLNNHIGIPLSLLAIPTDTEFAIIEMGANHLGEIKSYCQYVEPDMGLITNCGKAHLEGFGNLEGVRKGKGELFDYLRINGGRVFVNADLSYLREMAQGIDQLSYGKSPESEVRGELVTGDPFLEIRYNTVEIRSKLSGAYNFDNMMAAICLGEDQGVRLENMKSALEDYEPSNARSQVIEKDKRYIILDAYNANPSSMHAALENFGHLDQKHKIACIGGMKELGDSSLEEHQKVVDLLAQMNLKMVLLVGVDFEYTNNGPFHYFATSDAAGSFLANKIKSEEATILIKGSRTTQMENILKFI